MFRASRRDDDLVDDWARYSYVPGEALVLQVAVLSMRSTVDNIRSTCAVEIGKVAMIWSQMLMFGKTMPTSCSAVVAVFGRFDASVLIHFTRHSSNSPSMTTDESGRNDAYIEMASASDCH